MLSKQVQAALFVAFILGGIAQVVGLASLRAEVAANNAALNARLTRIEALIDNQRVGMLDQ